MNTWLAQVNKCGTDARVAHFSSETRQESKSTINSHCFEHNEKQITPEDLAWSALGVKRRYFRLKLHEHTLSPQMNNKLNVPRFFRAEVSNGLHADPVQSETH